MHIHPGATHPCGLGSLTPFPSTKPQNYSCLVPSARPVLPGKAPGGFDQNTSGKERPLTASHCAQCLQRTLYFKKPAKVHNQDGSLFLNRSNLDPEPLSYLPGRQGSASPYSRGPQTTGREDTSALELTSSKSQLG